MSTWPGTFLSRAVVRISFLFHSSRGCVNTPRPRLSLLAHRRRSAGIRMTPTQWSQLLFSPGRSRSAAPTCGASLQQRLFSYSRPRQSSAVLRLARPTARGWDDSDPRAPHDTEGVVKRLYNRYPNAAPLWGSMFLFAVADSLAQFAERQRSFGGEFEEHDRRSSIGNEDGDDDARCTPTSNSSYNYPRTLGVALCAPFFNGGPLLWFHRWIDRVVGPEPILKFAFRKMLLIQFLYMPFSTPAFIFLSKFFTSLLEDVASTTSAPPGTVESSLALRAKQHFSAAATRARELFVETYTMSFCLWPLSDLLNFTVIQRRFGPHFRSTWDAVIDVMWNFYLSFVTFRKQNGGGAASAGGPAG